MCVTGETPPRFRNHVLVTSETGHNGSGGYMGIRHQSHTWQPRKRFHRKLFGIRTCIWCIMFPKSAVAFAGMNCVDFTSETICICRSSDGPSRFDWKETGTPSAGNLYAMYSQIKTDQNNIKQSILDNSGIYILLIRVSTELAREGLHWHATLTGGSNALALLQHVRSAHLILCPSLQDQVRKLDFDVSSFTSITTLL